MKKVKKETNTLAIFYGITPRKLARLLENLSDEVRGSFDNMPNAEAIAHLSFAADTETKFIKVYLKDLELRKKQGKI